MNTHIYSDAKDIFPCFVFPVPTLNRLYTNIIFPFDISPFSKLVCARCGFFSSSDRQKAIPHSIQFFPPRSTGKDIPPYLIRVWSVRAHTNTNTLGWAGPVVFLFHWKQEKKKKKNLRRREGARIFPFAFLFGSSVLLFFHIVLHSIIEKEEKIIDIKRPLRRNEGESLFFSDQRLKGRKDFGRGERMIVLGKYGRHTIPITHENNLSLLQFEFPQSFFPLWLSPSFEMLSNKFVSRFQSNPKVITQRTTWMRTGKKELNMHSSIRVWVGKSKEGAKFEIKIIHPMAVRRRSNYLWFIYIPQWRSRNCNKV